jgi:hypothetical protein
MAALGTGPAAPAVVSRYMPHTVDLCSATAHLYLHGLCTNAPSPAHAYKVTGTVVLRAETSASSLPGCHSAGATCAPRGLHGATRLASGAVTGAHRPRQRPMGLHHVHSVGGLPFCASIPYSMHAWLRYALCIAWGIVRCHPFSSSSSSRMTASMIASL